MALKPLRTPNIRHTVRGQHARTTRSKRLSRWLATRATALSLTAKEVWSLMRRGVDADRLNANTFPPVARTRVTITGTATSGQILTRVAGTWAGAPAPTLTYEWLRGGVVVAGQTAGTYTLGAPDVGFQMTVRETATNTFGVQFSVSKPTATVA